jgi:17beta-estradiol 17-dehydrogenase / very-long-chain 3-oxoacyl-CoA reductase
LLSADAGRLLAGTPGTVTGATDGIGKGVAMQLAKRGVSVLLVSRTQQRLDDTAAEIKAACPSVETATLQFDFSSATEADYARLAKAVVGKDIGVLYNNVGISYSYAQFLEQLPDDRVDAIVEMNMRAMVKCTKLVLPGVPGQQCTLLSHLPAPVRRRAKHTHCAMCAANARLRIIVRPQACLRRRRAPS